MPWLAFKFSVAFWFQHEIASKRSAFVFCLKKLPLAMVALTVPCWLLDNHYKSLLFYCYCLVILVLLRHLPQGEEPGVHMQNMECSSLNTETAILFGPATHKCHYSQGILNSCLHDKYFKKWKKGNRAQFSKYLSFISS